MLFVSDDSNILFFADAYRYDTTSTFLDVHNRCMIRAGFTSSVPQKGRKKSVEQGAYQLGIQYHTPI